MTNPFADPKPNPFFLLQQSAGQKMLDESKLKAGDLATVAWRLQGYETEIESVMGIVDKIDANSIFIKDTNVPIEHLHKVRINRKSLKPEEQAIHADVAELVEETGGDPEAAFNAVWDMPEETTSFDPFATDDEPAPAVGQPTVDGIPVNPSQVFPHTTILSDDQAQQIIDSGGPYDDETTEENPFA